MTPCAFPANNSKLKVAVKVEGIDDAFCFQSKELAGEVLQRRSVGPFTLSEQVYAAGSKLEEHVHRHALLTFVVEGTMRETCSGQVNMCRPGALRFLPAGELHANEFESAVRCLHVSIGREIMDALERRSLLPSKASEIRGLGATWLANRLYAEFSRADQASAIALEGVILEILAEIARSQVKPDVTLAPRWLRHATEIVETRFLERLSLADIASEVGVHYVHLSRQFHKYNRCTIGELIRKRRIQYASHLLAHSQTPLAEIALICGFSDQSHLSFLFKRYMGLSPSKFRALAGVRPQTA